MTSLTTNRKTEKRSKRERERDKLIKDGKKINLRNALHIGPNTCFESKDFIRSYWIATYIGLFYLNFRVPTCLSWLYLQRSVPPLMIKKHISLSDISNKITKNRGRSHRFIKFNKKINLRIDFQFHCLTLTRSTFH
jgi:hypothetical protein